jgi:hypothetical protein
LQLSIFGDWRCEVVGGPPTTAVVVPLTVRIAPRQMRVTTRPQHEPPPQPAT